MGKRKRKRETQTERVAVIFYISKRQIAALQVIQFADEHGYL